MGTGVGSPDVERRLMDSFKALVRQYPVEKITIKQITDGAGVIRPTFYNHFHDKYEVVERVIRTEIVAPMAPLLENDMVDAAVTLMFANVQRERAFYRSVIRMEGQNSCESIIVQCIREALLRYIDDRLTGPRNHNWFTPQTIAEYYARCMAYVIVEWVRRDMPLPPNEMAQIYHLINTSSLDDIIRRLKQDSEA